MTREQPIIDTGIDAHIDRVDAGNPTGRSIGLQIKTGASHFTDKKTELVYYCDLTHLDYWMGHSLPVVLVAHLPDTGDTYRVHVTAENVEKTPKAWKIKIPKVNIFGQANAKELGALFEGLPAQQRFRQLALHEPLMRHVQNGGRVSVDLEDWINKSLGRTPVRVYTYGEDGTESPAIDWFQFYVGFRMKELAEKLFPWAVASVDEEFYDEHADVDRNSDYRTRGHVLC